MRHRYPELLLFLLFLAAAVSWLSGQICLKTAVQTVVLTEEESDQFRCLRMSNQTIAKLHQLETESSMPPGELLAVLFSDAQGDFLRLASLDADDCIRRKRLLLSESRIGYEHLAASYGAIFNDLVCFPVASDEITYENSWMFERTYGGLRGHEGTDLMPPENLPGHYRILSMTDGVVENIGWLPKGGYRIGIRSPSGGYFYYAHLDSYAEEFAVGDRVTAGTLLGYMGDSGYGEEGTRGKFDVHLHLGIYIQTRKSAELSVNPYWVLRYLEGR